MDGDADVLTQVALEAVAAKMAQEATRAETLCLDGPMGAGKSTFARAFLRARGVTGDIPSPTFTLVQIYENVGPGGCDIWHVDAYRVKQTQDVEALGLLDAFGASLCLIEWPGRIADLLPRDARVLRFSHAGDSNLRRLGIA